MHRLEPFFPIYHLFFETTIRLCFVGFTGFKMMTMRGAVRRLPFLSRLSASGQKFCGTESTISLNDHPHESRFRRIIPSKTFTAFSRGFASDALTPSAESGVPATVAALKTPSANITYDESVHERYPPGDPGKQAFTYFVLTGGRFIYAAAIRLAILKFLLSMSASKDVLALASLEVDLSNIEPGSTVTVKWRGKPVFIRHRTPEDIQLANSVNLNELRDPQPDSERAQKPEWLVVIGVCTHLGCVPLPNAGDYHGWFCPCHGSHYDISGRVRKGPAPYNLEVPTYTFMEDTKMLIG